VHQGGKNTSSKGSKLSCASGKYSLQLRPWPEGRESIGTAVSAASQVREGRVHVPPELTPNRHHAAAVQEEFLVGIKVRFFPLTRARIEYDPTPKTNIAKITDLEPQARNTRISGTFCQTSPAATHADGQGIIYVSISTYILAACLLAARTKHIPYILPLARKTNSTYCILPLWN
jgi:hypothetical protein